MTTTQPTGTKRPWWKTKWAAIAAVVIILAAIFGNMGDDEDTATIDAEPTEQATKAVAEPTEAERGTAVPDLTGKHVTEAMKALEEAGLEAEVKPDDPEAEVADTAIVEKQAPEADTEVEAGATVTIHVATDEGGAAEGEGEPSIADVEAALTMGTDYAPNWVAPITEMEVRGDTLEVKYQETTDFDEEWAELGQKFHNFLRAADPPIQMDTIVFTDAEGIDHNVFCGKTKCADSVMDTDI